MKEGTYVTIQWWMVDQLKLKGNELLVYAIIYGFCQDGDGEFNGSLSYLAEWTSSSKMGIMKALKKLIEKDYISKSEKFINGIKYCKYLICKQSLPVCNKVAWGMQQSLPNNIVDINTTKVYTTMGENKKSKFIKPTIDEIRQYCIERKNNIDAETFFDFYECKGWLVGKNSMKDWKAAVRTWERNRNNTTSPSKPQKESKPLYQSYEDFLKEQEQQRQLEEEQNKKSGRNDTSSDIEGLEDW